MSATEMNNYFRSIFGINFDLITGNANLKIYPFDDTGERINRPDNNKALNDLQSMYFSNLENFNDVIDLRAFVGLVYSGYTIEEKTYKYYIETRVGDSFFKETISFTTKNADFVVKKLFIINLKNWVDANISNDDLTLIYRNWTARTELPNEILTKLKERDRNATEYSKATWEEPYTYTDVHNKPIRVLNWGGFYSDLINGTSDELAGGQATRDAENKESASEDDFDLPGFLGFAEFLGMEDGYFNSLFGDEIADGTSAVDLEEQLRENPEKFAQVASKVAGQDYKEPTAEELISLRQCALITRLLHDDADKVQFSNYFMNSDSP